MDSGDPNDTIPPRNLMIVAFSTKFALKSVILTAVNPFKTDESPPPPTPPRQA
jgi:hypothetical protein